VEGEDASWGAFLEKLLDKTDSVRLRCCVWSAKKKLRYAPRPGEIGALKITAQIFHGLLRARVCK
jgi:hypothetical protein